MKRERIRYYITALKWADLAGSYPAMKANLNRWVHFSNGVEVSKGRFEPKLGINARGPLHRNPGGLYAYRCRYLLDDSAAVNIMNEKGVDVTDNGKSYGLRYKYFYIIDIKMDDRGINLETVTEDEICQKIKNPLFWKFWEDLAERRAKIEAKYGDTRDGVLLFQPLENNYPLLFDVKPSLMVKYPGAMMYGIMKGMVKSNKATWPSLIAKVSYLYDPGKRIIHPNEPEQIVVMDIRLIKVVTFGLNVKQSLKTARRNHCIKEIYAWARANGFSLKKDNEDDPPGFVATKDKLTVEFFPDQELDDDDKPIDSYNIAVKADGITLDTTVLTIGPDLKDDVAHLFSSWLPEVLQKADATLQQHGAYRRVARGLGAFLFNGKTTLKSDTHETVLYSAENEQGGANAVTIKHYYAPKISVEYQFNIPERSPARDSLFVSFVERYGSLDELSKAVVDPQFKTEFFNKLLDETTGEVAMFVSYRKRVPDLKLTNTVLRIPSPMVKEFATKIEDIATKALALFRKPS